MTNTFTRQQKFWAKLTLFLAFICCFVLAGMLTTTKTASAATNVKIIETGGIYYAGNDVLRFTSEAHNTLIANNNYVSVDKVFSDASIKYGSATGIYSAGDLTITNNAIDPYSSDTGSLNITIAIPPDADNINCEFGRYGIKVNGKLTIDRVHISVLIWRAGNGGRTFGIFATEGIEFKNGGKIKVEIESDDNNAIYGVATECGAIDFNTPSTNTIIVRADNSSKIFGICTNAGDNSVSGNGRIKFDGKDNSLGDINITLPEGKGYGIASFYNTFEICNSKNLAGNISFNKNRLKIQGGEIGILNTASGGTNAENITFTDCKVYINKAKIGIESYSKGVKFDNCYADINVTQNAIKLTGYDSENKNTSQHGLHVSNRLEDDSEVQIDPKVYLTAGGETLLYADGVLKSNYVDLVRNGLYIKSNNANCVAGGWALSDNSRVAKGAITSDMYKNGNPVLSTNNFYEFALESRELITSITATSNICDNLPVAGETPASNMPTITVTSPTGGLVNVNDGSCYWVQRTDGSDVETYTFGGDTKFLAGDNYYFHVNFYANTADVKMTKGNTMTINFNEKDYTNCEVWKSNDGYYYYTEVYVGPFTAKQFEDGAGTKYCTLQEALAANATDIKLLADMDSVTVANGETATLDLNGKTITTLNNSGTLTITGESGGAITNLINNGTFTCGNGTVTTLFMATEQCSYTKTGGSIGTVVFNFDYAGAIDGEQNVKLNDNALKNIVLINNRALTKTTDAVPYSSLNFAVLAFNGEEELGNFTSIGSALNAGATKVKLLGDRTEQFILSGNKTFTLDLNGFTLNTEMDENGILVNRGCVLHVMDSSAGKSGKITNDSNSYPVLRNHGTTTITDVTIKKLYNGDSFREFISDERASVTITGGTVDYLSNSDDGIVTLSGSAERVCLVKELVNEGSSVNVGDYAGVEKLYSKQHYQYGDEQAGGTVNVTGTSDTAFGNVVELYNGEENNEHGSVVNMTGYAKVEKLYHRNTNSKLTAATDFCGTINDIYLKADLNTEEALLNKVNNLHNELNEGDLRDVLINGKLLAEGVDWESYSDLTTAVAAGLNESGNCINYYTDISAAINANPAAISLLVNFESISIESGKTATIDLNGKTITTLNNSGTVTIKGESGAITTLNNSGTINCNHNYGKITYTWADDNSTCTANRVCSHYSGHVEEENATISSEVTQEKTCTLSELTTYTATFTNTAFVTQTKDIKIADSLGHDMQSEWSKDETNHWHDCTRCDYTDDVAKHNYSDDYDKTCDVCGYERKIYVAASNETYYETFEEAFTAATSSTGSRLDLLMNVTLDSELTVPEGIEVMLHLGNFTISGTGSIKNYGVLTVSFGGMTTITNMGDASVYLTSCTLDTLNNWGYASVEGGYSDGATKPTEVKILNNNDGGEVTLCSFVTVQTLNNHGKMSVVSSAENCNITTLNNQGNEIVYLDGGYTVTALNNAAGCQVSISNENGIVTTLTNSGKVFICDGNVTTINNGNGGEVEIYNSIIGTITNDAGEVFIGDGNITTINNKNSGIVNILNGTFGTITNVGASEGNSIIHIKDGAFEKVECSNAGYLYISGGTLKNLICNESYLIISDGVFKDHTISNTSADLLVKITGGTFNKAPNAQFIVEGYECKQNGEVYIVSLHVHSYDSDEDMECNGCGEVRQYVASVNNVKYDSLEKAVEAAQSGDEIVILVDFEIDDVVTIKKEVIIDLNGKQITGKFGKAEMFAMFGVSPGGKLTINDSDTEQKGLLYNGSGTDQIIYVNGGELVINGGTIKSEGETNALCIFAAVYPNYYTKITINGGKIISSSNEQCYAILLVGDYTGKDKFSFTMNGGVIQSSEVAIMSDYLLYLTVNDGEIVGGEDALTLLRGGIATIKGGTFKGNLGFENSTATISGGTFSNKPDVQYIAEGYDCKQDGEVYKVVAHVHVYDNACDTTCNECNETRTVGEHVYDNDQDTTCNECGYEKTISDPTKPDDEKDSSDGCDGDSGSGGIVAASLCLSVVLWFVIKKKTLRG